MFLEQTVASWKNVVIYRVYPYSHQDSDDHGVGDLGGIFARLDNLVDQDGDRTWTSTGPGLRRPSRRRQLTAAATFFTAAQSTDCSGNWCYPEVPDQSRSATKLINAAFDKDQKKLNNCRLGTRLANSVSSTHAPHFRTKDERNSNFYVNPSLISGQRFAQGFLST
jgi:hypothetical protein